MQGYPSKSRVVLNPCPNIRIIHGQTCKNQWISIEKLQNGRGGCRAGRGAAGPGTGPGPWQPPGRVGSPPGQACNPLIQGPQGPIGPFKRALLKEIYRKIYNIIMEIYPKFPLIGPFKGPFRG